MSELIARQELIIDDRNPCWSCGFNEEDIGCTANPYEPWTVPPTCYLYDPVVVDEMMNFYYGNGEEKQNDSD